MSEQEHPVDDLQTIVKMFDRRRLMQWAGIIVAGGAAAVAFLTPLLGYFLAPILKPKPDEWLDIGAIDDFAVGETTLITYVSPNRGPWDGMTAKSAAYVRRTGPEAFTVFDVHCAHLGCPVNWFKESGLFLCPCHGGVYYEDGERASGPPPRGLYTYEQKLENGRLFIKVGHLPTLQDTMRQDFNLGQSERHAPGCQKPRLA
jgi:Rieske Fe-S protein